MPFMFIGLNQTSSKTLYRGKRCAACFNDRILFLITSWRLKYYRFDKCEVSTRTSSRPYLEKSFYDKHHCTCKVRSIWYQFKYILIQISCLYIKILYEKRIQFIIVKCLYVTNYIIFDSKMIFILYGDIWGIICKHHVQLIVMLHIP